MSAVERRYTKGTFRRQEILQVALATYAASDRSGPRLREIADAAGLTEAGVLHYFESKDHLFVALLEERDRAAGKKYDLQTETGLWAYLNETLQTPGLAKLFVDMGAAASDPDHPAHTFLEQHDRNVREVIHKALGITSEQSQRLIIAAAEGLQLRWLREPETDVIADLKALVNVILREDHL